MITPTDKWSVKGDQMIGSKQRVSLLWNTTTFRNKPGPSGPPGTAGAAVERPDSGVGHRGVPRRARLDHLAEHGQPLLLGQEYVHQERFSGNVDKNWKDKVCIKNVVDCNQNFPTINFTEFTSWGSSSYNGTDQPGWGIKDDLSYIRGSHTFKFGFQHQNQNANGFGQQDIAGRADFNFLSTSIPGSTSFPASGGSSFASFLLGDAYPRAAPKRFATSRRSIRYFGFYAQDDWRVTRKLTINFGLRYDFTLPPTNAKDEYSDFNPTRPNPGADGYPGALWFAGFGPGRENTRSLVPGWYGGIGPRLGIAYALDNKTTIRAGFGRSFSRVTAVQGSGHFAGFIGQYQFDNTSQGVTPTFKLDQGLPPYKLPPSIDPAFSNGNTVDWWQGQDATRAPENLYWTFNMQRQIAAQHGARGRLQRDRRHAPAVRHPELQPGAHGRFTTSLVSQFGATQALNILRANITSPRPSAAGIQLPYPSFQPAARVAQALRPFPQYPTISTGPQNGDKSGHSSYHALADQGRPPLLAGTHVPVELCALEADHGLRHLLRQLRHGRQDQYNRRLEKSIGQFDQTHRLKFSTLYDLPFGKGSAGSTTAS